MEKKTFINPSLEIITIDSDEIICTSGEVNPLAPTSRGGDVSSTYGDFFGA